MPDDDDSQDKLDEPDVEMKIGSLGLFWPICMVYMKI